MNNVIKRAVIMVVVAALGIAGIVLTYNRFVQPGEPVWHEKAKKWETIPLSVSWDGKDWGDHALSFRQAIDSINSRVGCNLLRHSVADVYIHIQSGDAMPCGSIDATWLSPTDAAGAYLCPNGRAVIQIKSPGTIDISHFIAQHELLHVLGLTHDSFKGSMMFPEAPGDGYVPRITDKDTEALRDRYCR